MMWKVGGSNDERHHWFLYTITPHGTRYRNDAGIPVEREEKYVSYRTKKAATEALRELETEERKPMTAPLEELFNTLEHNLRAIDDSRVSPEAQLEKLEEEVGEVRLEVRNEVTPRMVQAELVLREAADVVIVAAMLCRAYGFDWNDLQGAVEYKMRINASRTWAAHNGTARHVRDSRLPASEE